MKVNLFSQPFMTPEIDIDYYQDFKFEFLSLTYFEWDNSLKIMKIPSTCVFTNGFEKFGSMVGGLS